ncbi:FAD-dependent oxidoreductase [Lactobacillus helveticus]|uniref:FAD-dependent oxidoreductase n=1 Tax=Lactobacillus helveticus TaxID=1587 RepID=UPI00307B9EDA
MIKTYDSNEYDVIVVGAGHAGCEAALASAHMGQKTLLVTIGLDMVAFMPCNPSVGGPAKGTVVREIDALGGQMGKNIDATYIQMRMLNTGKGPAVRALRAQADKWQYHEHMKDTIENTPNLTLRQAIVDQLVVEDGIPIDIAQIDFTGAWDTLGEITGESAPDELVTQLFSQFCLGK